MSLTAHKTYGPKGIGALYVSRDRRARIEPQMHGGGHELGMRSGTLATHQIVGMGECLHIAGAGNGDRGAAHTRAARQTVSRSRRTRRSAGQRRHGEPHRQQPQHQPQAAELRSDDRIADRHRGVVDFGVLVGRRQRVARAAGAGQRSRSSPATRSASRSGASIRRKKSISRSIISGAKSRSAGVHGTRSGVLDGGDSQFPGPKQREVTRAYRSGSARYPRRRRTAALRRRRRIPASASR